MTSANFEDDFVFTQRDINPVKVSNEETAKLDFVLNILNPDENKNPEPTPTVGSFEIENEVLTKIKALKGDDLTYQYLMSLGQIRLRLNTVLGELIDTLVSHSLKTALEMGKAAIQAQAQEFLLELQFQDAMSQSLNGFRQAYEKAVTAQSSDGLANTLGACFNTVGEREYVETNLSNKALAPLQALNMSSEKPLRVVQLKTQFEHWSALNETFSEILRRIIDRVVQSHLRLVHVLEEAIRTAFSEKAKVEMVVKASLETKSALGLEHIQRLVENPKDGKGALFKLLQMTSESILLQKRLEIIQAIFGLVRELHVAQINDDPVRNLLVNYGPNLNFIWAHALARCRTSQERDAIKKALTSFSK